MLLAFQTQAIHQQMEKQKRREQLKKNQHIIRATTLQAKIPTKNTMDPINVDGQTITQSGESATLMNTTDGSKGRPNLFLKSNAKRMAASKSQLEQEMGDTASGEAPPDQDHYQLAMSEALNRHEMELIRVSELKKL